MASRSPATRDKPLLDLRPAPLDEHAALPEPAGGHLEVASDRRRPPPHGARAARAPRPGPGPVRPAPSPRPRGRAAPAGGSRRGCGRGRAAGRARRRRGRSTSISAASSTRAALGPGQRVARGPAAGPCRRAPPAPRAASACRAASSAACAAVRSVGRPGGERRGLLGPALGLLEGGGGDDRRLRPDAPAARTEVVAVAGDEAALGIVAGGGDALGPAVDDVDPGQEAVEQAGHRRIGARARGPRMPSAGRNVGLDGGSTSTAPDGVGGAGARRGPGARPRRR